MGYRCSFSDRIRKAPDGQLVRIISASWNGKRYGKGEMDVYRIYEDGREEVRNLAFVPISGYVLDSLVPERTYGKPIFECNGVKKRSCCEIDSIGEATVKERYPMFRWMFDKAKTQRENSISNFSVWELLKAWKRWPDCERLLNSGFWKLCLSEPFAKASCTMQKKVMAYLKQHPDIGDVGYGQLLYMMKNSVSADEYGLIKRYKVSIDVIRYLESQMKKDEAYAKEGFFKTFSTYMDYSRMAAKAGHDVSDQYWARPNSLRNAHDKVIAENAEIEAAKNKDKQDRYLAAVKKWISKKVEKGGLTVYVPENFIDWEIQAKALHQCIVYADYIGKVTRGKALLLFVRCNGRPMATAELDNSGKIVQFYADEHDRENMKPTPEAESAVNEWIKKFKPKFRTRKLTEAA